MFEALGIQRWTKKESLPMLGHNMELTVQLGGQWQKSLHKGPDLLQSLSCSGPTQNQHLFRCYSTLK